VVQLGRETEVLARRQFLIEADTFGQIPDLALDLQGVPGGVLAADADGTGRRFGEAEQHQERRRLSGAVGAEEAEHLSFHRS
jgi:hypothetical protein